MHIPWGRTYDVSKNNFRGLWWSAGLKASNCILVEVWSRKAWELKVWKVATRSFWWFLCQRCTSTMKSRNRWRPFIHRSDAKCSPKNWRRRGKWSFWRTISFWVKFLMQDLSAKVESNVLSLVELDLRAEDLDRCSVTTQDFMQFSLDQTAFATSYRHVAYQSATSGWGPMPSVLNLEVFSRVPTQSFANSIPQILLQSARHKVRMKIWVWDPKMGVPSPARCKTNTQMCQRQIRSSGWYESSRCFWCMFRPDNQPSTSSSSFGAKDSAFWLCFLEIKAPFCAKVICRCKMWREKKSVRQFFLIGRFPPEWFEISP